MDNASKVTLFNALAYIDALKTHGGVGTEQVDEALIRLTEAFGVNIHDAEQKRQLAINSDIPFDEVFAAGLKALSLETGMPDEAKSMADEDPVVKMHPELWKKWVAKLDSKGFFKDATPGSTDYVMRLNKALLKFKEKFGDVKPVLTIEEKELKAEEAKTQGNAALSRQDYEGAAKLYREALQLSPHGPSSHIYHSNLAAALMYMGKYSEVIDHCEQSIALKPSYVKAYSRLGSAQVQLRDYDGAIDAYRRGLEVDSTNAACRDGLAEAERQRQQVQTTSAPSPPSGGAGGMPDLSNLASMLGGGGGLAGLMNNPQMMQMAQSMMQNPQMMQMAQNLMQNPSMVNDMMGSLGGANTNAPPRAGEMPDMSGLMNSPELIAARSDPDLTDFFRDVDSEGPSAAMRHMSNPKVSQLVQSVMSRVQG
ncbi:putative Heat shock chaperonin-binding, tetratricopeptide-like helical domain superfamily [Plasmopara halstedii]